MCSWVLSLQLHFQNECQRYLPSWRFHHSKTLLKLGMLRWAKMGQLRSTKHSGVGLSSVSIVKLQMQQQFQSKLYSWTKKPAVKLDPRASWGFWNICQLNLNMFISFYIIHNLMQMIVIGKYPTCWPEDQPCPCTRHLECSYQIFGEEGYGSKSLKNWVDIVHKKKRAQGNHHRINIKNILSK